MPLPHQIVRSLTFECLRTGQASQVANLVDRVGTTAVQKNIVQSGKAHAFGAGADYYLHPGDFNALYESVQQILWQLLAQGIIVWGSDRTNDKYPFYRVTEYGRTVLANEGAQPYDPDGFLAEFRRRVPSADETVASYFEEAVRSFNANCYRAAAILLGGASEKALLLLHEQFGSQIQDTSRRKAFDKDSAGTSIHRKYRALQDRLDLMVEAKKLDRAKAETVGSELPAGFNMIRRFRNEAGHPALEADATPNTVFLNLTTFVEYARLVVELIEHFKTNPAEW